jgi:hypothetical protein
MEEKRYSPPEMGNSTVRLGDCPSERGYAAAFLKATEDLWK